MSTIEQIAVIAASLTILIAVIVAGNAIFDVGFWVIVLRFVGYVIGLILLKQAHKIFTAL